MNEQIKSNFYLRLVLDLFFFIFLDLFFLDKRFFLDERFFLDLFFLDKLFFLLLFFFPPPSGISPIFRRLDNGRSGDVRARLGGRSLHTSIPPGVDYYSQYDECKNENWLINESVLD